VVFIKYGTESIRWLELWAAPLLIAMCLALLGWAWDRKAGGFGPMLSTPSQFAVGGKPKEGQFWGVFWPSLTAMVGFWATLALNIPDFTRFARASATR
jgi:NCS1 family nucleobase:cation symporter-1